MCEIWQPYRKIYQASNALLLSAFIPGVYEPNAIIETVTIPSLPAPHNTYVPKLHYLPASRINQNHSNFS